MALWLLGLLALARHRRSATAHAGAVLLVAPALFVLGVGMAGGADIGARYVIAVPMLLAVLCGGAFVPGALPVLTSARRRIALAGAGVALLGLSAVLAWGRELAYVNLAWGGTDHGYHLVADSSYDWGQDLGRLADWSKAHGPVYVVYFGRAAVTSEGGNLIAVDPVAGAFRPGTLAVSASQFDYDREHFAVLGQPFDRVGTMLLFHVPGF
jgi:hypothetical protein